MLCRNKSHFVYDCHFLQNLHGICYHVNKKEVISLNRMIIQSNDPDTDTLKCPKCCAIWRSKGYYNYDEGGWVYEDVDCPNGCCTYFLKKPIQGKKIQ